MEGVYLCRSRRNALRCSVVRRFLRSESEPRFVEGVAFASETAQNYAHSSVMRLSIYAKKRTASGAAVIGQERIIWKDRN